MTQSLITDYLPSISPNKKKQIKITSMIATFPMSHSPKTHYQLQTKSLKLKPYYRSFVAEYYSWFSLYPELLHLTGSQLLTLEEEIENHRSWIMDEKKYTFVVFYKGEYGDIMIGDVNLFFSDWIEGNQSQVNIMIAMAEYRGKGLSREVMDVVELFSVGVYDRNVIIAKIKKDNIMSIKFFEKIGYGFVQDNVHHGEMQYRKKVDKTKQEAIYILTTNYNMKQISNVENLFH